jgi:hypothetical protein
MWTKTEVYLYSDGSEEAAREARGQLTAPSSKAMTGTPYVVMQHAARMVWLYKPLHVLPYAEPAGTHCALLGSVRLCALLAGAGAAGAWCADCRVCLWLGV